MFGVEARAWIFAFVNRLALHEETVMIDNITLSEARFPGLTEAMLRRRAQHALQLLPGRIPDQLRRHRRALARRRRERDQADGGLGLGYQQAVSLLTQAAMAVLAGRLVHYQLRRGLVEKATGTRIEIKTLALKCEVCEKTGIRARRAFELALCGWRDGQTVSVALRSSLQN